MTWEHGVVTRKAMSNLQLGVNVNHKECDNNNPLKRWMNEFMLDSGTAFSMLANEKPAEAMFEATEPIDMHTNAGRKLLDEQATVPGHGDMHLNKEGLCWQSSLRVCNSVDNDYNTV